MTVRFEFTLNDIDACNLIDIMQSAKMHALNQANRYMQGNVTRVDQANADWYNGHAEYLEGLKQKVLAGNTRV